MVWGDFMVSFGSGLVESNPTVFSWKVSLAASLASMSAECVAMSSAAPAAGLWRS